MTKFVNAPMGEGKADIISRVANRSDLMAFEQEFVEHHALLSEAYAVARKINKLGNVPNKTDSKGETK